MKAVLILGMLALAGCGADGEPIRPTYSAGVSGGSGGVNVGGGVGLSKGRVSLGVGF